MWLAVDAASGERVAIKLLSLTEATDPPALQLAQQEIHALRTVGRHPNVAELLRVHWLQSDGDGIDGDGGDGPPTDVALVMESANGGGLFERSSPTGRTPSARPQIVRQLALAVYHAHSRGIVHRDLAGECVLRERRGGGGGEGDRLWLVGGAGEPQRRRRAGEAAGRLLRHVVYCARADRRPAYGAEVDLWSLGLACRSCSPAPTCSTPTPSARA